MSAKAKFLLPNQKSLTKYESSKLLYSLLEIERSHFSIAIISIESIETKTMAGKTISAYTDKQTADLVERLAEIEQRTPSQIMAIALKFFVKLPISAREAWYQIEAIGDEANRERAVALITQALIEERYSLMQNKVVEEMTIDSIGELETEDDILNAAIKLTE